MPSPFPGMNPYLEQPALWAGFQAQFLAALRAAISRNLPPQYVVRRRTTCYRDYSSAAFEPDEFAPVPDVVQTISINAPVVVTVQLPSVVIRPTGRLIVRSVPSRKPVTVVEVLTPWMKRPRPIREQYLNWRWRVLRSTANLVEIDLLRGGHRMPADDLPSCSYLAMVSRRQDRPWVGLWPIVLGDPLPDLPIPLRPGESEPVVSLKAVLDRVYDAGGYAETIYSGSPVPRLAPTDAAWAAGFVPA